MTGRTAVFWEEGAVHLEERQCSLTGRTAGQFDGKDYMAVCRGGLQSSEDCSVPGGRCSSSGRNCSAV